MRRCRECGEPLDDHGQCDNPACDEFDDYDDYEDEQ